MARPREIAIAALVIAIVASPAAAQGDKQVQAFPAEYFAYARPADAYDMVRRLPGFELIEGDEEVRGFTGSRGNVLFDGRSPSGKQETAEQMLRRIPAASVLRIELIRGGAKSTATGAYDLVANVVRRDLAATSASVMTGASAADEIGVKPDFRAELSRQSGDRRLEASAALETDIDDDSGRGRIVEQASSGNEIGREERDEREVSRTASLNAEYKLPAAGGELVANANIARERTLERILSRNDDHSSLARSRERLWTGEASGQYRATVAGGDLEALVVQRIGRLRARDTEDDESFTEATRTSETIARAEYRRGTDRLRLFGSIEGTRNRLTSDAELVIGGDPVPINGLDANVVERRAEAAVGAIWKPAATLVVEPTMRAETSTIRSKGDSRSREHFLFWKPRLRLSWDQGSRRIQTTIEREAAQLDFSDFVASAELDRDEVVAGATALKPPTTWSFSTTLEQRFWKNGALLLTYRREWIDDVIDEVLIEDDGELFDAVGNFGKGRRRTLKAELTVPFERVGIPGMQLKALLTFIKSRVTDPITGRRRIISEDRPFEGELDLNHDLPGGRWSWGAKASLAHHEREFRFDETRVERKGTSFGAHVEFRPQASWRLKLEAENIGSRSLTETRRKFEGTRASGTLDSIEARRLRTAPIVTFSLRKAFGGAAD
jgi:hypothetical protein